MNTVDVGLWPKHLKKIAALAAVAFGMALAGTSGAQAVVCPPLGGTGVQQFTLTSTAGSVSCFATGNGGLDPNNGTAGTGSLAGYTVIDSTSNNFPGSPDPIEIEGIGGSGDASGQQTDNYTLLSSLWASYSSLVLVLVSVEASATPDWVAFLLPTNTIKGAWEIFGAGNNTLDRAIIYGKPIAAVPIPAGIALLGGGLAMLGLLGRRRRSAAAAA